MPKIENATLDTILADIVQDYIKNPNTTGQANDLLSLLSTLANTRHSPDAMEGFIARIIRQKLPRGHPSVTVNAVRESLSELLLAGRQKYPQLAQQLDSLPTTLPADFPDRPFVLSLAGFLADKPERCTYERVIAPLKKVTDSQRLLEVIIDTVTEETAVPTAVFAGAMERATLPNTADAVKEQVLEAAAEYLEESSRKHATADAFFAIVPIALKIARTLPENSVNTGEALLNLLAAAPPVEMMGTNLDTLEQLATMLLERADNLPNLSGDIHFMIGHILPAGTPLQVEAAEAYFNTVRQAIPPRNFDPPQVAEAMGESVFSLCQHLARLATHCNRATTISVEKQQRNLKKTLTGLHRYLFPTLKNVPLADIVAFGDYILHDLGERLTLPPPAPAVDLINLAIDYNDTAIYPGIISLTTYLLHQPNLVPDKLLDYTRKLSETADIRDRIEGENEPEINGNGFVKTEHAAELLLCLIACAKPDNERNNAPSLAHLNAHWQTLWLSLDMLEEISPNDIVWRDSKKLQELEAEERPLDAPLTPLLALCTQLIQKPWVHSTARSALIDAGLKIAFHAESTIDKSADQDHEKITADFLGLLSNQQTALTGEQIRRANAVLSFWQKENKLTTLQPIPLPTGSAQGRQRRRDRRYRGSDRPGDKSR